MRKFFALMLALIMALGLVACGSETTANDPETGAESQEEAAPEVEKEPEEPAKVLEPIVYTGSGDDVIEIASIEDGYVFHITGNAGGNYFGVSGYDKDGNDTALLANETEPYDGVTLDDTLSTVMLEIQAVGDWTIELLPIVSLPEYTAGDTITGTGNTIFRTKNAGKIAEIKGNAGGNYFGVVAYGAYSTDLLANEVDPYEGKSMIKCDPFLFEVTAVGEWSITLN